ncbi:POLS2 protein, partial [Rhinopomastus cyanomelas]|nr:POLS2 protein [Rhinopomastus cyanomelas]
GAYVGGPGGGPDLALLRLELPLTFDLALRPLCLPHGHHQPPPGTRCWATVATSAPPSPQQLQSVEVTLGGSCRGDPAPSDSLCVTLPGGSPLQLLGGSPLSCLERGVWFLLGAAGPGVKGSPHFTAAAPQEHWVLGVTGVPQGAFFAETPTEEGDPNSPWEPPETPDSSWDPLETPKTTRDPLQPTETT